MATLIELNDAQLKVLRWIAEGCPDAVMEGYSHRISAVALRSRELVRIHGRGATWRAELTPAGEAYLKDPPPPVNIRRRPNRSSRNQATPSAAVEEQGPVHEESPQAEPVPDGPPDREIGVPSRLNAAHPFVIATRDAAVGLRREDYGRVHIGPQPGVVHMVVSRALLRRALLISQAIIREAEHRGWEVVAYDAARRSYAYDDRSGVALRIRGHTYPFEFYEPTETLPFTEKEIHAWRTEWKYDIERRAGKMPPPQHKRKQPTGKLRLRLPNGYNGGRATWTEGKRGRLEDKLWSVFATLEERAEDDDAAAIQAQLRAEEYERERHAQAIRQRQIKIENARVERLLNGTRLWQQAEQMREYIRALEARLPSLEDQERQRIEAWCVWASGWVERNDPSANTRLIVGLDDENDAPTYRR